MRIPQFRLAALALVSGIALSGCAYDMYGNDYGYGYGPYGGVGVGIGYGNYGYGYGYGPYDYGYGYNPYGYGYDPFGWYGDYYYPGAGIYVYDRYRTRHPWTDDQRRYWEQRRQWWHDHHSGTTTGAVTGTGENWSGWDRHGQGHGGSMTTMPTSEGNWNRGSGNWNRGSGNWNRGSGNWNRGNAQARSSAATTTDSDHPNRGHWRDREDDRR